MMMDQCTAYYREPYEFTAHSHPNLALRDAQNISFGRLNQILGQNCLKRQKTVNEQSCLVGFQSKALRMLVDALWYVPNTLILRDLHLSTV
jgi:hypothetical protein